MNILSFVNQVEQYYDLMTKESVQAFILEIARLLPSYKRDDFLSIMRKHSAGIALESSPVSQAEYQKLLTELDDIASGKLSAKAYCIDPVADCYTATDVDFDDCKEIVDIYHDATIFVSTCIRVKDYQRGLTLVSKMFDTKLNVNLNLGCEMDPLDIYDIMEHLLYLSYDSLVIQYLFLTYMTNNLKERPSALYQVFEISKTRTVYFEDIMQEKWELSEYEEFLPLWIDYLKERRSPFAKELLEEAQYLLEEVNSKTEK